MLWRPQLVSGFFLPRGDHSSGLERKYQFRILLLLLEMSTQPLITAKHMLLIHQAVIFAAAQSSDRDKREEYINNKYLLN